MTPSRRSPLALAVLALLIEEPLHPYRMQQLIRQRGKDKVVNVGQRATLYKTIDRLRRDGLIAVRETSRSAQFPERTVYEATEAGRVAAREWMHEMLSAPRREFPEFTAAVAHLPLLDPADAARQLELRRERLRAELAQLEQGIKTASGIVPREFLLEDECIRAMTAAELAWVTGLVDDLRSGRLGWSEEWLSKMSAELANVVVAERESEGSEEPATYQPPASAGEAETA